MALETFQKVKPLNLKNLNNPHLTQNSINFRLNRTQINPRITLRNPQLQLSPNSSDNLLTNFHCFRQHFIGRINLLSVSLSNFKTIQCLIPIFLSQLCRAKIKNRLLQNPMNNNIDCISNKQLNQS